MRSNQNGSWKWNENLYNIKKMQCLPTKYNTCQRREEGNPVLSGTFSSPHNCIQRI